LGFIAIFVHLTSRSTKVEIYEMSYPRNANVEMDYVSRGVKLHIRESMLHLIHIANRRRSMIIVDLLAARAHVDRLLVDTRYISDGGGFLSDVPLRLRLI
jgi:hypothetical protein